MNFLKQKVGKSHKISLPAESLSDSIITRAKAVDAVAATIRADRLR